MTAQLQQVVQVSLAQHAVEPSFVISYNLTLLPNCISSLALQALTAMLSPCSARKPGIEHNHYVVALLLSCINIWCHLLAGTVTRQDATAIQTFAAAAPGSSCDTDTLESCFGEAPADCIPGSSDHSEVCSAPSAIAFMSGRL